MSKGGRVAEDGHADGGRRVDIGEGERRADMGKGMEKGTGNRKERGWGRERTSVRCMVKLDICKSAGNRTRELTRKE